MADNRQTIGQWGRLFGLANVAAHASLLPNGKILYWGRRADPDDPWVPTLSEHFTKAFLLDLTTKQSTPAALKQKNPPTDNVNFFCSGHCFLDNGNLLIVGGHDHDGNGIEQACIYDWKLDEFQAQTNMNGGRWYPSALTLPDSSALVVSGSLREASRNYHTNRKSQIFHSNARDSKSDGTWTDVTGLNFNEVDTSIPNLAEDPLPLYPRLHLDPNGRVFMAGPQVTSHVLQWNVKPSGALPFWMPKWDKPEAPLPQRTAKWREYASSVQYDTGKILYTGGGNEFNERGDPLNTNIFDRPPGPPTKAVEMIDLNPRGDGKAPAWIPAADLNFARQQHNATVLPDGTVLVTGGTRGPDFNNLGWEEVSVADGKGGTRKVRAPFPVHAAELWIPGNQSGGGEWRPMAEESVDRCYHSTALLLPDGQVLSAGGGEWGNRDYGMCSGHTTAQLFKPPYLFKGQSVPQIYENRPVIPPIYINRPTVSLTGQTKSTDILEVTYNGKIEAKLKFSEDVRKTPPTITDDKVQKASLVRLGSVTHCTNMSQLIVFLTPVTQNRDVVSLIAPASPNIAPPGHYMLFLMLEKSAPPVAPIIRLLPDLTKLGDRVEVPPELKTKISARQAAPSIPELDEKIKAEEIRPALVVGVTPSCPYGLGPCWAAAHDALNRIPDIDIVRPIPDQYHSLAFVYLKEDILPDIEAWRSKFEETLNGSHDMRGFEITLSGKVTKNADGGTNRLTLAGTSTRPDVVLAAFELASNIEWDRVARVPAPISEQDAGAYSRLVKVLDDHPAGVSAQVVGRLLKDGENKHSLDVRRFEIIDAATNAK